MKGERYRGGNEDFSQRVGFLFFRGVEESEGVVEEIVPGVEGHDGHKERGRDEEEAGRTLRLLTMETTDSD